MTNNFTIEGKEGTYVKVINFLPKKDPEGPGESMWVLKTNGTINDGYGILMNAPGFTENTSYGDIIEYGEGTNKLKPKYIRNVSREQQESVEQE
tara:strand:- start:841 stop:1122 length:282 start_codon:yes stop_codon:yes gene_type:complete